LPQPTSFPYTTLFRSRKQRLLIVQLGPEIEPAGKCRRKGFREGRADRIIGGPDVLRIGMLVIERRQGRAPFRIDQDRRRAVGGRSEEHTSELQSRENL